MKISALFWLLLTMILAASCGKQEADAKPDGVYRVRGQVVSVHGSGADARATIAHEAIADFRDRDGKASGMPAMTMAFGIASDVDPAKLVPESKWELKFEVVWSREPAIRIVAAKPLPADTQLALGSH